MPGHVCGADLRLDAALAGVDSPPASLSTAAVNVAD